MAFQVSGLQLVVKCAFALFPTVVPQCIALDDGDVDVLPLHSYLHQPAVDRLPFHQVPLHSFPRDVGDSLWKPITPSSVDFLYYVIGLLALCPTSNLENQLV